MVKSMTGYGRFETAYKQRTMIIEIKSVNHRYSEINIKLPRAYIFLEETIRSKILASISRGKIDVFVNTESFYGNNQTVKVDETLLKNYYGAMECISKICKVDNDSTASRLARFPDVLIIEKQDEDKEIIKEQVMQTLEGAIEEFVGAREREGERIAAVLKICAGNILKLVDEIEKIMPDAVEAYRNRLTAKVEELLGGNTADETRILTETAIFADKICTDEEIVRLRSHISEFDHMLTTDVPIGRKLDFTIQEMNREINTIGSKANEITITKLVVEVKSEIEKLREQTQNIE